jgi:hypothetical protein
MSYSVLSSSCRTSFSLGTKAPIVTTAKATAAISNTQAEFIGTTTAATCIADARIPVATQPTVTVQRVDTEIIDTAIAIINVVTVARIADTRQTTIAITGAAAKVADVTTIDIAIVVVIADALIPATAKQAAIAIARVDAKVSEITAIIKVTTAIVVVVVIIIIVADTGIPNAAIAVVATVASTATEVTTTTKDCIISIWSINYACHLLIVVFLVQKVHHYSVFLVFLLLFFCCIKSLVCATSTPTNVGMSRRCCCRRG